MALPKDFFVSPEVGERDVKMPGGTQKLWFRKVSSFDWERFLSAARSQDIDQRAMRTHILIAAALCDPDGEPALTIEKAQKLLPDVAAAIYTEAFLFNHKPVQEAEEGNG